MGRTNATDGHWRWLVSISLIAIVLAACSSSSAGQKVFDGSSGQGLSTEGIIDKLAHEVMGQFDYVRDQRFERYGDRKGFL